jgi:hypothetical protein
MNFPTRQVSTSLGDCRSLRPLQLSGCIDAGANPISLLSAMSFIRRLHSWSSSSNHSWRGVECVVGENDVATLSCEPPSERCVCQQISLPGRNCCRFV